MKISSQNNMEKWQETLFHELGHRVRWDTITLQMYSTAACIYEITPLAVIIPENDEDILTTIHICHKYDIPILPRGAGTSLAGNAVGRAVILDLTHYFQGIEYISEKRIKTGVGVILNHLQQGFVLFDSREQGVAVRSERDEVYVPGGSDRYRGQVELIWDVPQADGAVGRRRCEDSWIVGLEGGGPYRSTVPFEHGRGRQIRDLQDSNGAIPQTERKEYAQWCSEDQEGYK